MGVATDKSLIGLTTAVNNISTSGMSDTTGQAINSSLQAIARAINPAPNIVSLDNTTSVGDGSYTSILSNTLAAGSWLITYRVSFEYNATGYRRFLLSNTTNTNNDDYTSRVTVAPAPSVGNNRPATNFIGSTIITLSSATTIYLVAYQNSGVSMSITGNFRAVKL